MAASTVPDLSQEVDAIINKSRQLENKQEKSQKIVDKVDYIRRFLSDSIIRRQIKRSTNSAETLSDEEAFLRRLSTYSSFMWSAKPRIVSPPVCASLGWSVAKRDLLECNSCRQFLSAELPPVWKQQAYAQAVANLAVSLNEKHHRFCPWPVNASKQNYLHERFLDIESTIKAFATTLLELNQLDAKDLPEMSSDLPEKLLNLMTSQCLLESASSLIQAEGVTLQEATMLLAICGWKTKVTDLGNLKLFCTMCFRETEPNLYAKSSNYDTLTIRASSTEDDAPSTKKCRQLEIRKFHPLNEHQLWCPWVDASYKSINGSQIKEGWKSLLDVITMYSNDKTSKPISDKQSPRDGVLATRRIMGQWITDVSLGDVLKT